MYENDDSLENLVFDLENFHRELKKEGYSIFYVFDELDKLPDEEDTIKIINLFKNLFTLSNGQFVFVGDETAETCGRKKPTVLNKTNNFSS